MAVIGNHDSVPKLLLDNGADPNTKDRNYETPSLALDTGNEALVKLLIEKGVDNKTN